MNFRHPFQVGILIWILCLGFVTPAQAVRLDTSTQNSNFSFGVNAFLGFEYAYMSKMPMVMETPGGGMMIGSMPGISYIKLQHLNLLFSAEKENLRVLINFHSHNVGSNEPKHEKSHGTPEIQEAYGEYIFSDHLKIRAGAFLSPFGFYNDVRYILPVFSSVVLPQIYDPPMNYGHMMVGGESIEPVGSFSPENANLMLWGTAFRNSIEIRYHLYLSNGTNSSEGGREDKDLGWGGRFLLSVQDRLKIGGSGYTVHNNNAPEGRARFYGADITVVLFPPWIIQSEYVINRYANQASRYSYYFYTGFPYRLWLEFLRYVFLKDPEHLLMKREQVRYTLGLGYQFKPNIQIKGEYHIHRILDHAGLSNDLSEFNMIRLALITMF